MEIYLDIEDVYRDWVIHECGGEIPVKFPRHSAERDVLEVFISRPPESYIPEPYQPGMLRILLPEFKGRPADRWFFLSNVARRALVQCIKSRFDLQLWNELSRFGYIGTNTSPLRAANRAATSMAGSTNGSTMLMPYCRIMSSSSASTSGSA